MLMRRMPAVLLTCNMNFETSCKIRLVHVQAMFAALSDTYMWVVAAT